MAGGIDWFRWHHGSVTDPKFQLVAKKAGVRLGDVLGIWAFLLEKASASADRGSFGAIDTEAVDLLFGLGDGQTAEILRQMEARGLIGAERVEAWDKRQPKREREEDPTSTERKRRQRAREADADDSADGVTDDCHAMSRQATQASRHVTPREEERREEIPTPDGVGGDEASASRPSLVLDEGMPPCPHQAIIASFHAALPMARHVREWTPARASLLRTRWREKRKRQTLQWWQDFFAYVAESPFLTGRTSTPGRKPFELGLEWLLKAENFAKVVEGAYHEPPEEEAA